MLSDINYDYLNSRHSWICVFCQLISDYIKIVRYFPMQFFIIYYFFCLMTPPFIFLSAEHGGIDPPSHDRRSRILATILVPRFLVLLGGFEPPLQGSTVPCSTYLSYSKNSNEINTPGRIRTDVTKSKAWSACPLHYGSIFMELVGLEPTTLGMQHQVSSD